MKKMIVRIGIVLALVFTTWRFGQTQSRLADFRITVEPSARGAKLECLRGCAWKTLSFDCDVKGPCKQQIDQTGVGPLDKAH